MRGGAPLGPAFFLEKGANDGRSISRIKRLTAANSPSRERHSKQQL